MGMLKLDVYPIRDLQNFLALLNQCETKDVTEIRFVRQHIHEFIRKNRRNVKVSAKPAKRKNKNIPCPECNSILRKVVNYDGLIIMGCNKCRYSEIIEEN